METAFRWVIGIGAVSIAYVYPLIAALHGRPTREFVSRSWGAQIVYVFAVCFGIPKAAGCFSKQLGQELVTWVPDAPIAVPILFLGWISPWLAGSLARLFLQLLKGKNNQFPANAD